MPIEDISLTVKKGMNMINDNLLSRSKFLNALPYPNIVVDNLFDNALLEEIRKNFPKKDELKWWKYDNYFEKKLAYNNIQDLHPSFAKYFNLVNSMSFVRKIAEMADIENLIADPSLYGGGLHMIEKGGKLDIHADFNYHRVTGWKRKLNMITFLNKDWDPGYGGNIELWERDMSKCSRSVLPVFNRTIIFYVDDTAYHGHPDPLNCPSEIYRKSLATYYYTFHKDSLDDMTYRSTDYRKRPGEKTSKDIEHLREKRRLGRIKDSTT